MRPFNDACVATGINIGSGTAPWGSVRREALALVVYKSSAMIKASQRYLLTEHLATMSKVKAGVLVYAMISSYLEPE